MNDDLDRLAARLKRDCAVRRVNLTDQFVENEAEAIGVTAEQLRHAIGEAVVDQGDGGGPPPD